MKRKKSKSWLLVILSLVVIGVGVYYANIRLYQPGKIWDVALFRVSKSDNLVSRNYSIPYTIFSPQKKVRTRYHYVTGYADPFLFQDGEYIYIFYEQELFQAPAPICAMRTKDMKKWESLGTVLKEDFHLSYPNVFRYESDIYMIPETHERNAVILYKAKDFPYQWEPVKELVTNGRFVDSCVLPYNGKWYLFTTTWRTEQSGLRIFISDSLTGEYTEHPMSPVSMDVSNMRCGGAIIEDNGHLYRPAQYDVNYYGENLVLYEITKLTEHEYEENPVKPMLDHANAWSAKGGHHMNVLETENERLVVFDGRVKDNMINNRTRKLFELFGHSANDN